MYHRTKSISLLMKKSRIRYRRSSHKNDIFPSKWKQLLSRVNLWLLESWSKDLEDTDGCKRNSKVNLKFDLISKSPPPPNQTLILVFYIQPLSYVMPLHRRWVQYLKLGFNICLGHALKMISKGYLLQHIWAYIFVAWPLSNLGPKTADKCSRSWKRRFTPSKAKRAPRRVDKPLLRVDKAKWFALI